jgi:hypothetical protein
LWIGTNGGLGYLKGETYTYRSVWRVNAIAEDRSGAVWIARSRIDEDRGKDGRPDLWGFGDGKKAFFWIKQGKPDPTAIHWGFMAENKNKVDEFYEAAMSAGARDNISPRARMEYYPGYYAADVCDPDGYSFEVVQELEPAKSCHKVLNLAVRRGLAGFEVALNA